MAEGEQPQAVERPEGLVPQSTADYFAKLFAQGVDTARDARAAREGVERIEQRVTILESHVFGPSGAPAVVPTTTSGSPAPLVARASATELEDRELKKRVADLETLQKRQMRNQGIATELEPTAFQEVKAFVLSPEGRKQLVRLCVLVAAGFGWRSAMHAEDSSARAERAVSAPAAAVVTPDAGLR